MTKYLYNSIAFDNFANIFRKKDLIINVENNVLDT